MSGEQDYDIGYEDGVAYGNGRGVPARHHSDDYEDGFKAGLRSVRYPAKVVDNPRTRE